MVSLDIGAWMFEAERMSDFMQQYKVSIITGLRCCITRNGMGYPDITSFPLAGTVGIAHSAVVECTEAHLAAIASIGNFHEDQTGNLLILPQHITHSALLHGVHRREGVGLIVAGIAWRSFHETKSNHRSRSPNSYGVIPA